MFATIMEGKTDFADWMFLIAVILAVVATILYAVNPPHRYAPVMLAASVAAVALGFLAL